VNLFSRRLAALLTGLLAPVAGGSPQASRAPDWADEILQAHNSIRTRLNLRPLLWSDKIAAAAQQWAEVLLARNQFAHRPNSAYGENLFQMVGAAASPTRVVNEWAAEARNYDYASNRCKGVCGHYTQIIWRDSKEVGCGVAREGRREIWVCEYNPPGNWVGRKPY
jgi:pathogenesis-related protein 1